MKATAGRKKKVSTKVTEKKEVEKVVKEKDEVVLSSYKIKGKSIVSKEEAKMLLTLKDRKGEPMISLNRGTEVYQLLLTVQAHGFQTVYDELTDTEKKYPSLSYYFLDSMNKEKRMYVTNILQQVVTKKMAEGVYKCKKCGETKTSSISAYSRGDEPPVQHITCLNCRNYWKEK